MAPLIGAVSATAGNRRIPADALALSVWRCPAPTLAHPDWYPIAPTPASGALQRLCQLGAAADGAQERGRPRGSGLRRGCSGAGARHRRAALRA